MLIQRITLKIRQPKFLYSLLAIFILLGGLYFVCQRLVINLTPSMPLGVYWNSHHSHFKRGDTVAVCLSKKYQDFGLSRDYLVYGSRCHGSVPLIKKIIALPKDKVILLSDKIAVNDVIYPYVTLGWDSKGRLLSAWPRGAYKSNGYWLIGTNDPRSWDSRYWGEVKRSQILYLLMPIWTVNTT